jgi:hypothetical protein
MKVIEIAANTSEDSGKCAFFVHLRKETRFYNEGSEAVLFGEMISDIKGNYAVKETQLVLLPPTTPLIV